jgi:hypothetical protein
MSELAVQRHRAGLPGRILEPRAGRVAARLGRKPLLILAFIYLAAASVAGSMRLDMDEFAFVREPYQLLGGDYTAGYVRSGEYGAALASALKAH